MAKNAFEGGSRKVIPAVLVYLKRDDRILMLHRVGMKDGKPDFHQGKWNGLGGKLEADESALEAACREVWEEAGIRLSLDRLRTLGFLLFPNFKAVKSEDWQVTVFVADLLTGEDPKKDCLEGQLDWISEKEILNLNLWPGDRLFIPYILGRIPFSGTFWYENGKVARHQIAALV